MIQNCNAAFLETAARRTGERLTGKSLVLLYSWNLSPTCTHISLFFTRVLCEHGTLLRLTLMYDHSTNT